MELDGLPPPFVTLTFWLKNLISVSPGPDTWPNFSRISSSSCQDIAFTRFLDHCLLWPWPFDR